MSATEPMFTDEQYKQFAEERNRKFKEKYGREMTWEDLIATWGGRPGGISQDTGRRSNSGSADDGIVDQT